MTRIAARSVGPSSWVTAATSRRVPGSAPSSRSKSRVDAGTSTVTAPVQERSSGAGSSRTRVRAAVTARADQPRVDWPAAASTMTSSVRVTATGDSHHSGDGRAVSAPSIIPASRTAPASATKVMVTVWMDVAVSPASRQSTVTACRHARSPNSSARGPVNGVVLGSGRKRSWSRSSPVRLSNSIRTRLPKVGSTVLAWALNAVRSSRSTASVRASSVRRTSAIEAGAEAEPAAVEDGLVED